MRRSWLMSAALVVLASCTDAGDEPAKQVAPAVPTVLDACESLEASRGIWDMKGVVAELSAQHVTGGTRALKLTFDAKGGALVLKIGPKPRDWSMVRTLRFDVFNPQEYPVEPIIRIDDDARGFRDRYEPCDALYLPPGKSTTVVIDLQRLFALDGRWLDPGEVAHFNIHFGKAEASTVVYVDSFRFELLPEAERRARVTPADEPLVLDDAESPEKSRAFWKAGDAPFEVVPEHAVEGKGSLRVTFPSGEGWPGIRMERAGAPLDWQRYNSLVFDAFNPSAEPVEINVRIDDVDARGHADRYGVGARLPAGRRETVRINLKRPTTPLGRPVDKSRITMLAIFTGPAAKARVVHLDNVRLEPGAGGLRNEVRIGSLYGETPETLGKKLLDDPDIKPLIPIFKAMGTHRMAIVSHSASISAHWSTSGAFFDIAAEAVRHANPNVEYKGFHHGGMSAGTAVKLFLSAMEQYKPTDTYILVVPSPWEDYCKLGDTMKAAGSRVFYFDAIKPWGPYKPELVEATRKHCAETGATFLELMSRGWGAPGSQDWTACDTIHMTTAGHLFYAKELLKEWARIYAAEAK